eukprot:COSAG05_NODE_2644_length_2810_cov_16.120251_4_plen_249_part_00
MCCLNLDIVASWQSLSRTKNRSGTRCAHQFWPQGARSAANALALSPAINARHRVEMKTRLTDITQAHRLVAEASATLLDATASSLALQQELLTFLGGDPSAILASQPALSALQLSRVQQALDEFPTAVTTAIEVLDDSKRKKRSDAATTELNRNKAELNLLRKDEQNVKTLVNTLVATNSAAASTAMGESEQEELIRLRQQGAGMSKWQTMTALQKLGGNKNDDPARTLKRQGFLKRFRDIIETLRFW